MRKPDPAATPGTPVSETVTPSWVNRTIATPAGVFVLSDGISTIDPASIAGDDPSSLIDRELRGGMEYVRASARPVSIARLSWPDRRPSVGLVKMISVAHPPPFTTWGKMSGCSLEAITLATGSVDIRNSPRSFTNPRIATAATGTEDANVNAASVMGIPLNGLSLRNRANWLRAGIRVLPYPKFRPRESVKKNDRIAA